MPNTPASPAGKTAKTDFARGRLEGFYQHFPGMKKIHPDFLQFLQNLATFGYKCRWGKSGPSNCEIRECTKRKNVNICPQCKEYSCQRIQELAERYATLIQDGKRLQEIGVERWVSE